MRRFSLRPIALRAEGRKGGKFKFELPSNSMGIGDWGRERERKSLRVKVGRSDRTWALLGRKSGPFRLQSIN